MNRLHRSRKDKVIMGVCGGLAEYFNIDATLVRIVTILVAISGVGFFAYLVAALIMPEDKGYTGSDPWGNTGSYTGTGSDPFAGTGSNGTGAGTGTGTGSSPNTGSAFHSSFESEFNSSSDEWGTPTPKYHSEKNKVVLGAILVGLGILFLGKEFFPRLFDLKYLVPVLLIGIGGIIVFRGRN